MPLIGCGFPGVPSPIDETPTAPDPRVRARDIGRTAPPAARSLLRARHARRLQAFAKSAQGGPNAELPGGAHAAARTRAEGHERANGLRLFGPSQLVGIVPGPHVIASEAAAEQPLQQYPVQIGTRR